MGTIHKPTITELREHSELPAHVINRIEEISIRLIEIQDIEKTLEREKGYTDRNKERHPGISDELEDLYIRYSLPGVQIEDRIVIPTSGAFPYIDKKLLLARGVSLDDILAATVSNNWTGIRCQRLGPKAED